MFHLSWGFKPLLNESLLNSRSLMKLDSLTPLGRGQRFGQHSFYLLPSALCLSWSALLVAESSTDSKFPPSVVAVSTPDLLLPVVCLTQ